MQTGTASSKPMSIARPTTAASRPWWMLISRSVLFVTFQLLIALVLRLAGTSNAWEESTRYWTFLAFLTNFVSLVLLVQMYRAEGKNFWDILRFSPQTWKKDLLWFLGLSILGMPIAAAPREPLAAAIFGDGMIATHMLFKPLTAWAFVLSFLFPLTIWFSELPTYFGYVMPRLEAQTRNGWLAWFLASFFLAAQHMFLPLILNGGFMFWRFGMFLPFALFTGLVLKFRPALLPYFVIVHTLLDISTVLVYLMI